jgi:hypothetical protein
MHRIFQRAAAALALVCLCAPALPQTYHDSAGTIVPGVIPLPFSYTPLSPGQHNLAATSSTALSAPIGARYATVLANFRAISATGTLDVEYFQ